MGETIATVGDLAGLCGHDGTDWIKALIDAAGHLQIDVVDSGGADLKDILDKLADILTELNAKLETADLDLDASGRLSSNAHHYDGSAWRKANLLWGYHDRYTEKIIDQNLSGGTNTIYGAEVPSGEIWRVTFISGYTVSASITWLFLGANDGTYNHWGVAQASPASYQWYLSQVDIPMKEGDSIAAQVLAATAGDDLAMQAWGYKMDIGM